MMQTTQMVISRSPIKNSVQLTYQQARLTFVQGRLRDFHHLSHLFPLFASTIPNIIQIGNYNTVFYSFQEVFTCYCGELLTEIRSHANLRESGELECK